MAGVMNVIAVNTAQMMNAGRVVLRKRIESHPSYLNCLVDWPESACGIAAPEFSDGTQLRLKRMIRISVLTRCSGRKN
jgi:hypothetical protein